eukprot:12480469-Ditylum_brightwellii.AAC.1
MVATTLPLSNKNFQGRKCHPPLVNHQKLHDRKVKRQFQNCICNSLHGNDPPAATDPTSPPLQEDSLNEVIHNAKQELLQGNPEKDKL